MPSTNTREREFSLISQLLLACFSEQRHAVTLQAWTHLPHPPRVYMLALSSQSEQVTRCTHRRSAPTPAVQGDKVSTQTTPRPSADSVQGTESVRTDLGFPGQCAHLEKGEQHSARMTLESGAGSHIARESWEGRRTEGRGAVSFCTSAQQAQSWPAIKSF